MIRLNMNKNSVCAVLLLCTISGYAASNELVVTKPYTPGLRARYNTQFKAGLTTAYALGAACAYANRAKLDKTGWAAFGSASLMYLHQMMKKQHLLDILLTHPKSALDQAYAVYDTCIKEAEGKRVTPENMQYLRDKYTTKHPLFLLGECTAEDSRPCILSRCYEPNFREQYESRVVTSLGNKLSKLDRPVQYVSFGSGGMFQDHVALTKALAKNPDAKIDVHLIDIKHKYFVACRESLNNTREVDYMNNTDPNHVMESARKYCLASNQNISENVLIDLTNDYQYIEFRAQQSIAWLSRTFPQAQLKLYLHDSTASYHAYIDRENIAIPDVIAAADIDDEMSWAYRSGLCYAQLCIRALQRNPLVDNIWLRKDFGRPVALLTSVALEESAGAEKENVKIENDEEIPLYITSQKIPASASFFQRLIGR